MDKDYGLFVIVVNPDCGRDFIDKAYMEKFDTIDDFMSGIDRLKFDLDLYTMEEFFNHINDDKIYIEGSYSQIIQLKK